MRLWDAATGAAVWTLTGHTGLVLSVVFSPNGTQVASASHDYTVRLWDAATGAAVATLASHTGKVLSVAFSPDGTRVASASCDTVRLWDAATGAAVATLAGDTSLDLRMTPAPHQAGGLFGAPAPHQRGGLFGAPAPHQGGGLFGAPVPHQGGGLFGGGALHQGGRLLSPQQRDKMLMERLLSHLITSGHSGGVVHACMEVRCLGLCSQCVVLPMTKPWTYADGSSVV